MEIEFLKWVDVTFHGQVWLNHLMKYITYIGEFGAGAIIFALVLLIFGKTRWTGVAVAIALLIDVLLVNVILKLSVNRPRPWTEYPELGVFYESCGVRLPTDSSFPSGHTAAMFAAAVAFTFKYKVKGIPVLIVATLVALSRVYLCVHYPTGVLGGFVIGSACGAAGYFIAKAIEKYVNKRKKRGTSSEDIGKEL